MLTINTCISYGFRVTASFPFFVVGGSSITTGETKLFAFNFGIITFVAISFFVSRLPITITASLSFVLA